MKYSFTEIEKIISSLSSQNLIYTNHAKQRLIDRNLSIDSVNNCILNNSLFGVIYQEEGRYLLILNYDNIFDLYVIVRIINSKDLNIITVYINFIDKRVKN